MDKPSAELASQEFGVRYIELLWKTIRDEIPDRLDRETARNILTGRGRTYDITGHWDRARAVYRQARARASANEERGGGGEAR